MAGNANPGFRWSMVGLVVAVLVAIGLVSSGFFEGRDKPPTPKPLIANSEDSDESSASSIVKTPSTAEALGVPEDQMVDVGGVKRPKRDLAFSESAKPADDKRTAELAGVGVSEKTLFPNPGRAPAVPKDANPQVAKLFEELSSENPPDAARSALFAPEPFDKAAYEADREIYLSLIRPGRAYQSANPGPDVKRINSSGPMFQSVLQGEKVILRVDAEPGAPVTFYTPQVGEFPNRLTTYSVAADEKGVAEVTYVPGPGSLGLVDILAASPLLSGQLQFKVKVVLPE